MEECCGGVQVDQEIIGVVDGFVLFFDLFGEVGVFVDQWWQFQVEEWYWFVGGVEDQLVGEGQVDYYQVEGVVYQFGQCCLLGGDGGFYVWGRGGQVYQQV